MLMVLVNVSHHIQVLLVINLFKGWTLQKLQLIMKQLLPHQTMVSRVKTTLSFILLGRKIYIFDIAQCLERWCARLVAQV